MTTLTGTRNPFLWGPPIFDPVHFHGRKDALSAIFDCLWQRASVNVIGEPRIGKSSLLHQLRHRSVQECYDCVDEDALFLYVDPHLIRPQGLAGFYAEIAEGIRDHRPELVPDLDRKWTDRDMRRLLERLQPSHLSILIDEFETIGSCADYPCDFYDFLRGWQGYGVSFVIATHRPIKECCPQNALSSPFFGFIRPLSLGPFSSAEYLEFLEAASQKTSAPLMEVAQEIEHLVGHQPYLVQMACSHYFEALSAEEAVGPELHQQVAYRVRRDAQGYFEHLWQRGLSEVERDVLLSAAKGQLSETHSGFVIAQLQERGHLTGLALSSSALAEHLKSVEPGVVDPPPGPPPVGPWLDEATGEVYLDGKMLVPPLTKSESLLFRLLWDNRGRICDYNMIAEAVYFSDLIKGVDDARISALLARLRKRIEPNGQPWKYIRAVHGRGVRLVPDGKWPA